MITIHKIKLKDLEHIRDFIKKCKPLGFHTLYTYWVLAYHCNDFCFVAREENDEIIGFISAIVSQKHKNSIFLWQIGVLQKYRSTGLSHQLIDKLFQISSEKGFKSIQLSIDPDNKASFNLFKKYAESINKNLVKIDNLRLSDKFSDYIEYEDIYQIVI